MNWHDFVFSTRSKYHIRRHVAGWLCWWAFIILTIFFTTDVTEPNGKDLVFAHHQPGLDALGYVSYGSLVLLKSFFLLLIHMLFCYCVIYILLPNIRLKKRYWLVIPLSLMLCVLTVPIGYFVYSILYPWIDSLFAYRQSTRDKFVLYRSIDASLVNAIKVTLVVSALKLLKEWWLKQKAKERLEKEKINAELQLLKAQIHPTFLFGTLNNIISHAQAASPKAPEMLIKLSDLLSYMLYECDGPSVMLDKEIGMVKEYMALEKIRQGDKLDMTFQINGDPEGLLISPLLLLPFIDNSFSYCNNELVEQAWINMDITIEDNSLSIKLINGIPGDITSNVKGNEQPLENVKKRLELLYHGRHELKINAEQELLMVHLNLKLEKAIHDTSTTVSTTKPSLTYA